MGVKLGLDAKLYYLSTGTRAAWPATGAPDNLTELDNAKDVTLNLEKGSADVTTRAANGWRVTATTLKDASVEFEMVWDTGDEGFTAIKEAFFGNTSIAVAVLDGDAETEGTQGLWADFEVAGFSRKEPLEEALSVSVTLKPAYSAVAPEWVSVTAAT